MSLNTMRTLILGITTVTFLVLLALANFSIMQFQLPSNQHLLKGDLHILNVL
ncbi:hypothetical protein MYC06_004810 [Vibrio parahaemolyticus]|uniref:hypothetical protein n=1 Tax=Vibrio alginolyticus TaxID=663 RepID=UPI00215C02EB|nr:hypothetical protein [Vibrio alginolyticus]EJC7066975.1 hypothetical protein [Vibrio parahaemolyticus]EJF9996783.1 hypothetical protein [Vibrio parahaemolyticus]EJG0200612.1 hypothetical protein [Vibrio parahaemolyticus]EJG0582476.1 hypothetical protein [Vibrio parahaemolyticus]MCR9571528.1 hypothetical protein [Vibrio alginolyticus]